MPGSAVHGKVKDLEACIRMIHMELRKVGTEHTIFDDPATVGALVNTLAKATQTWWFLFLGEHPGQQGALFR